MRWAQHVTCMGSMRSEHKRTLNRVDDLGGQDVDLRVILTLHSHVTCQSGVCMRIHMRMCMCPLNIKASVPNLYITGLKRKVTNYTEQMILLLMD
jgi:hypothetical protein